MRTRVRVWLLLLVVSLLPWTAAAQVSFGTVRGSVVDAGAVPLERAPVQLVHEDTGERREVTTGPGGEFAVALVPPGRYRLEVAVDGFRRHVEPVVVQVNQEVRAAVTLQVGSVAEHVTVEAPAAEVDRGSASLGVVIDARQITDLPLDGRNFLELALLAPGTAPAAPGSAASVRGDFAISINGAREDATGYLLDGADIVDPKLNTPVLRPPVDAIQEFEVLTGTYDAAFGRYAGGHVNVVTRSGGNAVHGTAYEFARGGWGAARNVFAPADEPAPMYERHQFGASIGGPLRRGRTFFFGDYEGSRLREGITRVTNVPTARERVGDFSQSAFRAPVDPFTGQPFPGGVIPPERLDPVGLAIAALYPAPNRDRTFQNHVSSPVLRDDSHQADARLTHAFGDGVALSVRYSLADRQLYEPFAGPGFSAVPGYGNDVPRRGQNLVASHTHALGGSLLNEVRVSWSRIALRVTPDADVARSNAAVGLPEIWSSARDTGLSFVTVAGFSPLGSEYNNPQRTTTDTWQVSDSLTWSRGAHLARFGVDLRGIRQRGFRDVQSRGFLTFADQGFSGNALGDMLLGWPIFTGAARIDNPQDLRTESYGLFAQDSWRVRPDLTVSAGLRYDLISPPVDPGDRATLYDPATRELVRVGTQGVPRGGYVADTNNLAPRLGIVWTLPRRPDLVLRAGYGTYYNQSSLAPGEGLYFNAPYYDLSLFFPLPGLPLSLRDPFPAFYPIALPDSALAYQRDLRTPYLHQWSASVQKAFGTIGTAEIGYVGTRGRQLLRARDLNQAAPSASPVNLRPDPRFADITIVESGGRSRYDALQMRYQQRQAFGLSMIASYTYAHSWDDASGFFASAGDANFPQDSNDPAAEWGRSAFDVRHRLSVGFSYELPGGEGATGLARALATGWQLAGIVTLQSGRPFTVALLSEIDNSNTGRSSLGFGANDRPNVVGHPSLNDPSPERWFDTSAFAMPPFGSFGDVGRNTLEGPGQANVNLGLLKQLDLWRGARLQVRLEAFNVFNRANYGQPDNFFGSPTFGQVLTADAPRRVQVGVKLTY